MKHEPLEAALQARTEPVGKGHGKAHLRARENGRWEQRSERTLKSKLSFPHVEMECGRKTGGQLSQPGLQPGRPTLKRVSHRGAINFDENIRRKVRFHNGCLHLAKG